MSTITIHRDPADPVAASEPVTWAVARLLAALRGRGWQAHIDERPVDEIPDQTTTWHLAGGAVKSAARALKAVGVPALGTPEAFAILPDATRDEPSLIVCGSDVRGLVYAILEIADRIEHAEHPAAALPREPVIEHPANVVRSVTRLFCSEVEDKPWFYDDGFWRWLPVDAGHAAIQPIQPHAGPRLQLPSRRNGCVPLLRLSVPALGAGIRRPCAAAPGRGA